MPWAALAAAVAVAAGLQYATPHLVGVDSAFHIRFAAVIREAGLAGYPPPFPWLPLTILAPDRYADHHMLYHLFLVPFTLGDLRLGGKLAAVTATAILLVAFAWVLRRERVPAIPLALLALGASSADLLFRLGMVRVQALSVACLLVGFHLALAHRHLALAALACVYAWLYDGFLLLAVPVGAVVAAELVAARRLRPGIALAALAGAAVGLVVNPYFPEYLTFMAHHFGDKLVESESVRVGREWLPYNPISLLGNALMAMLYVALGVAVASERGILKDRRALAALLVAATFLALMLRSKRFIEYFAPAATLFAALTVGAVVPALTAARRRALVALLAAVATANVVGVAWAFRVKSDDLALYAPAARLVAERAPPGAMLCATDWDDFPPLYFHNVESTYLVGLDPTYLRNRFRDAYWQWVDVTRGRSSEPARLFRDRLPCAYVFSDRLHGAFLEQAAADPGLTEVLANDAMVLFRVERDGPPPVHPTRIE
jgi:hypothetical protein